METKEIKILAIDDSAANLTYLKALISETFPGTKFIKAHTGEKGIELFHSENPDVILLDIGLPMKDGYEVCRLIKSDNSAKYVPVIMITAALEDKVRRIKALESGADAFLSNPIDESELKAQIKAMIRIKESEERKQDEKERLQELVEEQTREFADELKQRIQAENELQKSYDKLEKSRQLELNLLENLRVEISERKQKEEALIGSEKKYRNLHESIIDGFVSVDLQGNIKECNESYRQMVGYSIKELKGLTFMDLTPEKWHKYEEDIISSQVLKRGYSDIYEKEYRKKDGSIFPVELHVFLISDDLGHQEGMWAIVRDITQRKQAEWNLKVSEERFRSLYENAPIGIYRTTPKGQILLANSVLVKLLGYKSLKELKNRDLKNTENYEPQYSRTKFQEKIERDGKVKGLESAWKRKDGKILYVRESAVLVRDGDGNSLYYDGTIEDITERKLAEKALKESQQRFKVLFEGSPDAIVLADAETGIIIDANNAVSKLLLKPIKDIKGLHQSKVHPERIKESVIAGFKNHVLMSKKSVKSLPLESFVQRSDGFEVPVEIVADIVTLNGKQFLQGVFRDITQRRLAETALRDSEGRFRSLFENMVEGFAYCKMLYENGQPHDFLYLDVNLAFETLTGLKNVKGKKVSEVIPGIRQSDPELFETYNRVALTGKPERFESYVESLKMWFHISVYSPEREYFVAVFDVINERKLAEEALKESEEKYRGMVDISPDAVIIHADGNILFVNPAALNLIGAISSEQLVNQSFDNLLHPDCKDIVSDRIARIYQTGKSAGFTELKFITLRNEIIDAEVIGIPINYMGKHAIQTIARDITNRKAAENALRESHDFNSSLLRALPFGMQIVDESGTILFMDEKFSKLFGDQGRGKKCWEVYRDDQTQCYDCPLLISGIEIGKTGNYESKGVLGGKIFDISHTGMMYKGKKAMLEIFQDITERKLEEAELIIAKEKAEESDRLKSAFLATMNHELRTPLNHILGFSSLIQSGVEANESREYASTIEASGKNLLSIIEDIFELSLVEQANIKVRRQTFNLMDHFMENKASLDDIVRSSGKNEQIELIFTPDTELLSSYITTDRSKINQVLANLFKNAIKFTHSGKIEFGYKMENHERLKFYVKDTGIGISKEKQHVIFDFFRQGDDSHTRLYGGIGIGLAISLKITHVLNGELQVESEPGKGSTFYFTIPVERADAIKQTELTPHNTEIDLFGKTILVVEDDALSMSLIKTFMRSTRAMIIEACEGEEAIIKWQLHPEIDLVLMDLKMPGMDGFEASRILKSKKQKMPIIALTAYSLTSDKDKAKEAGCDTIVTKPVDQALLFAEIKKMIQL